ncbi:hypothetical protein PFICI_00929 [Pestalotiopsis fici W106-1]|uniref:NACHT domain-containing protein n=1 Tax=Pestalotiopsis fici (strain W106-1 / CGMCC3.15140) TaxID=1229662 RepID=W3XPB0_PESFW|nr:uncharacterized protein PFICI_00929 [Pestalotiopsis fici W106-1]ETS87101.1 hypothetical protein PFICI_00929 [Pestalotiopsis fici W106-1]
MAEAVATLALASSILQVIDFGTKIATTAFKIYQASRSSDESLDEVSQLQVVYTNLSSSLKTLQTETSSSVTGGEIDENIQALAQGCSDLAKELLETLRKLGFGKALTKRKALWAALKHTWKHEQLVNLQIRLDKFKSELTLCVLISVRQVASLTLSRQGELLQRLGKSGNIPIGTSVLEYVTSRLDASSQEKHRQILERDLIETIQDQKAITGNDTNTRKIETTQKVKQKSIDLLLASLEYPGMQDREGRIADPHEVTFKWIFEKSSDKWISLREWLESDGKLYWITGKAGSGKSTLMRYISHPYPRPGQQYPRSRSHEYLERWAGNKRLIVASFYFWNSGLEAQTTQRGLLMTLLRQIFEQCPDLLALASPSRWEKLCLFGLNPDWTDVELRTLLLRSIENLEHLDATVALFVDGLDEFGGDLKVLISMFEEIRKLPCHKLCVASRPWNEFRDAFSQKPSLMVEHFTHDDIKNFIIARFDSDPRFVELRSRERNFANQLVEDIVSKSSGVFLWVSLVVSSLLTGMSNGDRIIDFQRRLDLLPPDLSDLYRKMIQSLDKFYLEHTSQLFALVGASREPMNLLLASYVDEDPRLALQTKVAPLSDQDVNIRMDTMRRRINSRSKGLLEVSGGMSTQQGSIYSAATHREVTVQYLHRTVKDFIESDSAVRETLRTALKPTFDPHLMLLAGRLAYSKVGNMDPNKNADYLTDCLLHARAVKEQNIDIMIELLDNMSEQFPIIDMGHKHFQHLGPYSRPTITFMSLATACYVVEYIRVRGTKPCLTKHPDKQWPLLMDAVFSMLGKHLPATIPREHFMATIEVLLENGADPKFKIEGLGEGPTRQMSPLALVAVGLMEDAENFYRHLAWQLLAKKDWYDSWTMDCITNDYALKPFWRSRTTQFGFKFWARYRFRKSVRKALNDAAKGGRPDISQI